jgi:hypothetical protein
MGLLAAKDALTAATAPEPNAAPKKRKQPPAQPTEPTRRSRRTTGDKPEYAEDGPGREPRGYAEQDDDDEEESEEMIAARCTSAVYLLRKHRPEPAFLVYLLWN